MIPDLGTIRGGRALEQLRSAEQHAGRAEAALKRIVANEGVLQVGNRAACIKPLQRGDFATINLCGQHQTAANDVTVYAHGTRTAHTMLAAHMGRREVQLMSKKVRKVHPRRHMTPRATTVHQNPDFDRLVRG
jgi:hypothetical protein